MTFSIVARDPGTGDIGAAVATGTPAVGGFVLHLAADIGGIATQGYSSSTLYGPAALRRLEEGAAAGEVVRALTGPDEGRDYRQLIVLDRSGGTAGWTGASNVDAKLHVCSTDLAAAGNWIASEEVVEATRRAYFAAGDAPLVERLLSALRAGAAAGGDSRGNRSAAIRVVGGNRPPLDLRVDLHDRPIDRLEEIYEATGDPEFQAFLARIPTPSDPMRF